MFLKKLLSIRKKNQEKEQSSSLDDLKILMTKTERSISELKKQGFYIPEIPLNRTQKLDFEKARFNYFKYLFEKEQSRKDSLDKKAQFFLSFISLFVGAIFLKTDFLKYLNLILKSQNNSYYFSCLLTVSLIGLGLSILVSLLSILRAVSLRKSKFPVPKREIWFDEKRGFRDEEKVLKQASLSYLLMIENDYKNNQDKVKWINCCTYSIMGIAICSILIISIVTYFSLYV
jgi:hypothetical protein